tara:strand:- start:36 stop:311 length:276 start_codon:yes stop_codon:yes gene_type:complete
MTYSELYDLTPAAFWNAVDGFHTHNENIDRKEWIRVRWQTCLLINIKLPRGKQMTLQKLLPFDWEAKEKSKIKTLEQTMLELEKIQKKRKI